MSYQGSNVKEEIAGAVQDHLDKHFPDAAGICIYAALFGIYELNKKRLMVDLCGGSMKYRICDEDRYQGNGPMWLSYVWNETSSDGSSFPDIGMMREVHCWLRSPLAGQVIDFSVSRIPLQTEIMGLRWETEPAPDVYWGPEVHENVEYKHSEVASAYVGNSVRRAAANLLQRKHSELEAEMREWLPSLLQYRIPAPQL